MPSTPSCLSVRESVHGQRSDFYNVVFEAERARVMCDCAQDDRRIGKAVIFAEQDELRVRQFPTQHFRAGSTELAIADGQGEGGRRRQRCLRRFGSCRLQLRQLQRQQRECAEHHLPHDRCPRFVCRFDGWMRRGGRFNGHGSSRRGQGRKAIGARESRRAGRVRQRRWSRTSCASCRRLQTSE